VNPYGLSKWMVEEMLKHYDLSYSLRHISLRYFNAAGASRSYGEDHRPESHLIPRVILAALGKTEGITVFGTDYPTEDGTCIRDYIHVEDLAEAHVKAMELLRSGGASDVLNLGNAMGYSVLEVITTIRKVTGRDFPVAFGPRRPGDPARLVAAPQKAQRVLGWRPQKAELETIVKDAWEWFQSYPNGYKR